MFRRILKQPDKLPFAIRSTYESGIWNTLECKKTKKQKKLVNVLSDLHISTNYKKVINIKKVIAQTVWKQKEEDNGVFIPSSLKRDEAVFFAIDNFDLAIDTPDGKKQLHGTGTVVYQEIIEGHAVRGFDIYC